MKPYENNATLTSNDPKLQTILTASADILAGDPRSTSVSAQCALESYIRDDSNSFDNRLIALQRHDWLNGCWDDAAEQCAELGSEAHLDEFISSCEL